MRHFLKFTLAVVCVGFAGQALAAGSQSGNMTVSCTVPTSCAAVIPTVLEFAPYDPLSATPTVATTGVRVTCNRNTVATVTVRSAPNDFNMVNGTDALAYNLYTDAAMGTNWRGLTATQTSAGISAPLVFTLYGVISPGIDVPAATYSDTVTIDVVW